MSLQPLNTRVEGDRSLLSPVAYDEDASSLHSRSEQDTDSEDDQLVARARNSRELRARDRMVLMEEEEIDQLVIDTRAKQERQRSRSSGRRESGLALPNPIQILRSYNRNRSYSPVGDSGSSAIEDSYDEKRTNRRMRRKDKRDRLLKEAENGEDGALIYEMEGGGMKEGSSTGDSSDRDDSDEIDRRRLQEVSDAKSDKARRWRRWLFIHTLIVVGFAFLLLLAWKLSVNKKRGTARPLVSNGTALFAPTTLLISLDGFRADFLQRGITPRLNAFVKEGVSPLYMLPSFPSVTFPNHYTIATGLYPESHGIVGNTFWDPSEEAEFYYTDPDRSLDPKWWGGEPFWVTAEQQGLRTAIHMWPGSEASIMDVVPSFLDKYNGDEELWNKTARILELLDKPGLEDPSADIEDMRPQLIAAYVRNVDAYGHRYGPNSTEMRSAITEVDSMLDELFQGLEARNLSDIVNVIVVSDHGMATTDVSRMIQIDDLIDLDKVERIDGWPLTGIRPKKPEDLQVLYEQALEKSKSNPYFEVYLRDKDMPERYHFSNNDRIAPLWIIPKTGWAIVKKEEFDIQEAKAQNLVYHPKGLHGYDHEHPLMRAIFVARGPAFPHQPHSKVEVFQNIEVYNILCDSVGMKPVPNNGTLRLPLSPVGLHDPESPLEEPADPEEEPAGDEEKQHATGLTSTLPAETPSKSVGDVATSSTSVSPVKTSSETEKPSSVVDVDPVEEPETHPAPGDEDEEEDKDEEVGPRPWWKSTWDWVSDKFDELSNTVGDFVGKVTGSKDDS
ncbi:hypothetical protein DL768_005436 [Monosporascus sp. mg162]|nr:hypothetical protein DL768_005436 [Monosporascus sp. mg162]